MKKLFVLIAAALLLVSCTKKNSDALVPVSIHVNDFSISVDTIPSKDDINGYTGVKAVTLAFYKSDDTEQYKVTQFRSDPTTYSTFGDFSLDLPMGSYTMVVLGYGLNDGEPAITLTSPTSATFGTYPARETFVATQEVNITNTDAIELSATLNRVIAKIRVISTDARTENAEYVRITVSAGSKAFNPTSGLATSNTGFSNQMGFASSVGATAIINSYLFLVSDEQTVTVTIDVLDALEAIVSHKVVENVPLQRNRVTKLTGSVFNASSTTDFEINTTWLSDLDVPF